LLQREGYRVALAADGCRHWSGGRRDADGWCCRTSKCLEWTASIWHATSAANARLKDLPIVHDHSGAFAEKHREHAKELGVDHYPGQAVLGRRAASLVKHYSSVVISA